MKHFRSSGIVLKKVRHRIIVLDELVGMIETFSFHDFFSPGSLFCYLVEQRNIQSFIIGRAELLHVPLHIARADIFFLHYLIDFVVQSAPIGSGVEGIFSLFQFLYSKEEFWFSEKNKKYILFKVASSLGLWPVQKRIYPLLLQLARIPIDSVRQETIDLISEDELNAWLEACTISLKPHLNFLSNNDKS